MARVAFVSWTRSRRARRYMTLGLGVASGVGVGMRATGARVAARAVRFDGLWGLGDETRWRLGVRDRPGSGQPSRCFE
ncbi:hypothetical protein E2562_019080 [Oryza meyeriana var. granulata]|uniref:Uncharacterized protein n=1 Tax=Oryza meyeriana var. granulata TaxID=110450 RepID=A0A6G1CRG9_9ORYZ|nr:hypothetical protein E2562_019080 [Oryza meyeriana var. granulata]